MLKTPTHPWAIQVTTKDNGSSYFLYPNEDLARGWYRDVIEAIRIGSPLVAVEDDMGSGCFDARQIEAVRLVNAVAFNEAMSHNAPRSQFAALFGEPEDDASPEVN